MKAVNLIPGDQRPGAGGIAGRSGGGALIVLAMLAALAVLAFVYGKSKHEVSTSRGELASANAELTADRAQAGRLAPYTTFIASANQRTQEVSQLIASRFDWSHAFSDLGRVLPRTATLTTLTGTVGAGGPAASSGSAATTSATSATPPGSTPTFSLTGCATTQSQVALTLQRLRLMDGVTEVGLQASTKSGGPAGGSIGSSGSCGPNGAAFSAQVSFQPLPAPTLAPATPGGAASTGTPVSTGASSQVAVPVTSAAGGASR